MPGYKDTAGLERACRIALALGFDGKQCIHPAQLATVNAVVLPVRRRGGEGRRCRLKAYDSRGDAPARAPRRMTAG